jgi:glycine oxidase
LSNREVYDYVIIGQGIAGSVMAMTLIDNGKSVYVIDSPTPNTSSVIAAGIMNPITGKRMTLTWKADTFFPYALSFYKRMELEFGATFVSVMPITRIFGAVSEQNDWSAKCTDVKYQAFIKNDAINTFEHQNLTTTYGSMDVNGGGRLNTSKFLEFTRNRLIEDSLFEERHISFSDVKWVDGNAEIGNVIARNMVYCTGLDQDLWQFLPFTPMKGEVLELESSSLPKDRIMIGGCFLSPINNDRYYAGATYNWRDINVEKTEEAQNEILAKVRKFTSGAFELKSHRVGIRPAVKDRRPMLGSHPEHSSVYLFSGLGSKGVSMAPYLAENLFQHMEHGRPLEADLDLRRFVK